MIDGGVATSGDTSTVGVLRGETAVGAGSGASLSGAITEPLAPGARVGRYEIVRRIGRGGMGLVYVARDPELDRAIAVKVLRTDAREPASALQARMLREARALARLSHPGIVQIFDVGVVEGELGDPPRVWLAMELVVGGTLGEWLARAKRSVAEIVEMFVAAGGALAAAHAAGIVHRDFKPSNVLLGTDARPRVVDFGLALARGE
ncbi:MAG TPA: serine/threonine-protein kinase, partial [Nannocystaceae bacterium]|nr:serine/threonine-protein kinase [Nannocystaceae bacterium]